MLTRADAAGEGYLRAPRLDRAEVRLLWHVDFWDGARSGMLLYRGESCWFEVVAEDEDDSQGWYRRFVVVRLFKDQLDEERHWHELFRLKVGMHTDYDEHGARQLGPLRPREEHSVFYDEHKQREPADLTGNAVLGWFEW